MVFVQILVPVFLLIGAGVAFSRTLRPSLEPLTQFGLYLATPALVFSALTRYPVALGQVGRVALLMVLYIGVMWLVSEAAARALGLGDELRRAFALATVTMNVGNYGLPLVRFAFGPASEPFSVLLFVAFNLPLATWAIWVAAGGRSGAGEGLRQTLRIPIFHATLAAFALSAVGWSVPGPVARGLSLLGEAAIPVLLVILGMQLQRTRVSGAPGPIAAAVAIRLGLSPLVAWGLTSALGFTGLEQQVAILQTSTPSAVLPLLYALRFGCQPQWLASTILVSTLCSGVSLTAVLAWLL